MKRKQLIEAKTKRRGVYVTLSESEHVELAAVCARMRLPKGSLLKSGFFQWLATSKGKLLAKAA